jgi:hypothetical protein
LTCATFALVNLVIQFGVLRGEVWVLVNTDVANTSNIEVGIVTVEIRLKYQTSYKERSKIETSQSLFISAEKSNSLGTVQTIAGAKNPIKMLTIKIC